ncbi:MAG: hypothetical protein AABN95_23715 [Acidobacteriota bacterium]
MITTASAARQPINRGNGTRSGLAWLLVAFYIGSVILFISIYVEGVEDHFINRFSNIYLIIPLLGGLHTLSRLIPVRALIRNSYRVTVAAFSVGLLLWSIGCTIWMYLIFKYSHAQIPYPSMADAFYALCFIAWTVGLLNLYKTAGKNVLHEINNSTARFLVPLWAVVVSLIYLKHGSGLSAYASKTALLKLGLDIFFLMIDLLNLGLLITLLPSTENEKLGLSGTSLKIISLGYFFLCLASSSFTICSSLPDDSPYHYYNGGFTDFMFATAFTVIGIGLASILVEGDNTREIAGSTT